MTGTKAGVRPGEYASVVEPMKRAFGPRLKTLVLFGSHARGTARPASDHDILAVIDGLPKDPLRRQRLVRHPLREVLHKLPGAIAFVAKTPQEVEANLTPLLLDVCADGICLHGAEYFEPYRRKGLEALKQSGLRREQIGETLMWTFPGTPPRDWELEWDGYREHP
jgi:predicted nucleotidyltransferase